MEGKPKTYARLLTNSQQNNDGGKTQDIRQTADQAKKNINEKDQDVHQNAVQAQASYGELQFELIPTIHEFETAAHIAAKISVLGVMVKACFFHFRNLSENELLLTVSKDS